MALVYNTGTINELNAAAVGQAMANQIRDDAVAHAAWELVEEFTAGGGAVNWTVLRCLAAESGLPNDFYVIMGRTLSTGELRVGVAESYNTGTKVMSGYGPMWGSTNNITLDSSGKHSGTWTLGTSQFSNSSYLNPNTANWTPSGTSTKWWSIVADDTISVAYNGASNGFFHAGAYDYLGQVTNDMPLQLIANSTTFGPVGILTRSIAAAGVALSGLNYNEAFNFNGGSGAINTIPPLGFQGYWAYNDKLQNDQRPMAEVGMTMRSGANDWPAIYGYALGKQKRMRFSGQAAPAGFAFGDAYALNGTLWVPYSPTDGRIWDTGIAS